MLKCWLQRRERDLKAKGLLYVGSGVSGGEDGARYGPSLMPGGSADAWYDLNYIFHHNLLYYWCCYCSCCLGTVENHGKKWQKNTAHFCENCKNHGKITAVYIVANLLKFVVSNSRKISIQGKIHTTMTSRSHIPPVGNKPHRLW